MHYMLSLSFLILFVFPGLTHAQTTGSVEETGAYPIGYDILSQDSSRSSSALTADPLFSDTLKSTPVAQNQPQKLMLVKKKYNSRQQVLLATGMMIFVVGIMTMAQQWNPQ
jgi:hypothetical protein